MILFLINKKCINIKNVIQLNTIIEIINKMKNVDVSVSDIFNNKLVKEKYYIILTDGDIEEKIYEYNIFKKFRNTEFVIYININPNSTVLFDNKIEYYFSY